MVLFFFGRKAGLCPGCPAALEGKNAWVAVFDEMACRPGTGSFIFSGTIQYKGFVFAIFSGPLLYSVGLLSNRTGDFRCAAPP